MNQLVQEEKFKAALQRYFDAYFTRRNLEDIRQMAHPLFSGFGTGGDEAAFGKDEFIEFFRRDIESAPNPLEYEFTRQKLYMPDEKTGVFLAELNLQTVIMEQELRLNNLRMLLVLHDDEGEFVLAAKHISFPAEVHDADEAYPLKELEDRAQVLSRMVEEKTKSLQEAYSELADIINNDRLTGVASRHFIEDKLATEWERFRRFGRHFCALFLDVDDFKQINDNFGHDLGDTALQTVGEAIRCSIRSTDIAGRWGGDEFLILLPETSRQAAGEMARRISETLDAASAALPIQIGLSVGCSQVEVTDQSHHDIFLRADAALYEAKAKGKNQLVMK